VHLLGKAPAKDVGDLAVILEGEVGEGEAAPEVIGASLGEKAGLEKPLPARLPLGLWETGEERLAVGIAHQVGFEGLLEQAPGLLEVGEGLGALPEVRMIDAGAFGEGLQNPGARPGGSLRPGGRRRGRERRAGGWEEAAAVKDVAQAPQSAMGVAGEAVIVTAEIVGVDGEAGLLLMVEGAEGLVEAA
jgi:hypothetical protein